jgi:hypothetical protein
MIEWNLQRDGFCLLPAAVSDEVVSRLLTICKDTFESESAGVRARSSGGHVYAARNLIQSIPEVRTVWRNEPLLSFLREQLGEEFGLVRALFFDKPPDRTWNLAWHKERAAVDRLPADSSFRVAQVRTAER